MPLFSAFTEFGLYEFSSEDSLGETIYDAIWATLGTNFARDGYTDAKVYMWALAIARLQTGARRVEDQIDPFKILDLLPAREFEFGLVANADETIAERRAELAAAMAFASVGGTYGNMRQALINLLGADFVDLKEVAVGFQTVLGGNPIGDGPALFALPSVPRYRFTLTAPYVGPFGGNVTLALAAADVNQPFTRPGDRVLIEPENEALAETVTVLDWIGGGPTAVIVVSPMTKPKDLGATLMSQAWPWWISNKRHHTIVVSLAAGDDPLRRAAVHALMRRMARGVSTWAIISSLGPFVLSTSFELDDGSHLDTTPTT